MKRLTLLSLGLLATLPLAPLQAQVRIFGGNVIGNGGVFIDGGGVVENGATPAPVGKGDTQLRWQNGETLTGQPLEATETELAWKTPLFADPLRVRWDALRRIDRVLPSTPVTEPFAVRLRDGSHLYGDVKALTADAVKMHSARHGDFTVKRSEILTVRRLRGGSLTFAGPIGDVGWKEEKPPAGQPAFRRATSVQAPAQPLTSGPAGSLVFPFWNSGANYQVSLPALTVVEFRLRSTVKPDFRLTLATETKQELQIETWDEDLVVISGDEFRALRKVTPADREISLRVCWDRPGRRCLVYTAAGEKLAEWKLPEGNAGTGTSGVTLSNKGQNLTLETLRVHEWEGEPLGPIDLKSAGLELGDGRFVAGEIGESADDRLGVQGKAGEASERFPLGAVDGIVFSTDPPAAAPPAAKVTFADGTVLVGRVASLKDNALALHTGFSPADIKSQIDGMRELVLPSNPAAPLTDVDELVLGQTTMHGKLTGAGTDAPRWVPVGGTTPVALAKAAQYQVTRAVGAAPAVTVPSPPALFYTSTGDVLPGTLRSLDRTGVEIQSPIMDGTKLPAATLSAIQFGIATPRAINGFLDPGWRVLKGNEESVKRTEKELKMNPDTSIGHPSAMAGDEISFEATWSGYSAMRMRLFCDGMESSKGTGLLLGMFGENWMSGLENADGNLENQIQTRVTGRSTKIRLVIKERSVELYLNGGMVQSFPMEPSKRAGSGLILEPSGLWGNPVSALALANFSVRAAMGRTWLPDISREVKSQALTVPRFRKEDPPRQALLAANGDVLRGEVEAMTNTHIAFRSGLESLHVPIDRVKAIIWLQPPDKDPKPATPEAKAEETLLDRKVQRRSRYRSANLASMLRMIALEVPELQFQPPAKDDQSRSFDFGGQTVREILEQLCPLFGVRYRVEGGKKVIFENTAGGPGGLVTNVYWLKPGTLSVAATPQEFLLAKGILFPTGAAAQWLPDTGQLTMTNTSDNHTKLNALLKNEFGGTLGSPTHWLQLVSGARIALAVDKFEKDAVVGRHPIYGKCRVPLAEIFAVRTTPPDSTSAMRSLQGWRLVSAPEPVIEGADGESSSLVGKDAKPFKLPMLGGGDSFELAAHKGQVVVLDFWATWCGPCIKSLPGLTTTLAQFPADKVQFVALNQSEPAELVKSFMEARNWKFPVALDAGGKVAQQYSVEGLPTTIVIGPDGKIASVKVGYDPGNDKALAETIKKLLEPPKAPAGPVP